MEKKTADQILLNKVGKLALSGLKWKSLAERKKLIIEAMEEYKDQEISLTTPASPTMEWVKAIKIQAERLNILLEDEDLDEDKLRDASEGLLPNIADLINKIVRTLSSPPAPVQEGEEKWVSVTYTDGSELPDYDVPVLWLMEDGNMYLESLDKDGNPWLFGQDKDNPFGSTKATHWMPLPLKPKP